MNKKIWIGVFGLLILMFPAVVGATVHCFNGLGAEVDCEDYDSYLNVSEVGSTTDPTIVGSWRWFNNKDYDIRDDGKIYDNNVPTGIWTLLHFSTKEYILNWNSGQYIDDLFLIDNGLNLNGYNQSGQHVTATRIASPCTASLDQNLLLHIPNLAYSATFTLLLGTQYLAVDFIFDPFLVNSYSYINFELADDYSFLSSHPTCASTPQLVYDGPYLDIHIPDVVLNGTTHAWVGLRYDTVHSTATQAYFYVYLYALNY